MHNALLLASLTVTDFTPHHDVKKKKNFENDLTWYLTLITSVQL